MSNLKVLTSGSEAPIGEDLRSAAVESRFLWLRALLVLAAAVVLVSSLIAYFQNPIEDVLRTSVTHLDSFAVLLALLFAAYLQPRLTLLVATLAFCGYLQLYQVPRLGFASVLYLICCAATSLLAARRLIRQSLPSLQDVEGANVMLGSLLFFSLIFLNSYLLLGLGAYSSKYLFGIAAGSAAFMLFLERKQLFRASIPRTKTVGPPDVLGDFLATATGLLLLFAGFMYLYPGALTSDANKGYLAIAKFYVLSNSLLLEAPAWSMMNMRAFPHMQEIILSAGYLLGQNIGAKLLAWLIVVAKLHAVYFLGRQTFRFSRSEAYLSVLLFGLAPLMLELNSVVRPENLLTVFTLYLVFALERASQAISISDQGPSKKAQPSVEAIRYIVLAGVLGLLTASVKYTAFFVLLACTLVYWRVALYALRNLLACLQRGWIPLALSAAIGGFWYLRNVILWDQIVCMVPRGTYHLTVWFPPLRSLSEVWTFLLEGLIRTNAYTEFPAFAYGPLAWLLIPTLLVGLTADARLRRVSAVALLYSAFLLFSTRQIRYLAIILPFAYVALVALLASFNPGKQLRGAGPRFGSSVYFVVIALSAAIALQVNHGHLAVVGPGAIERFELAEKDFSKVSRHYAPINEQVHYPSLAMTSLLDVNYEIDAQVYRIDPIRSLGRMKRALDKYSFSHFLTNDYFSLNPNAYVFGDREFIHGLGNNRVEASSLHMLEIDQPRVEQLFQKLERLGWDLDQTLLVSEPHFRRHASTFEIGERFELEGFPERLYRVNGLWEPRGYHSFGRTPTYDPGKKLSWYLEDVDPSSRLAQQNLAVEISSTGLRSTVSEHGIPGVVLAEGLSRGRRRYRFQLPSDLPAGPLVAELQVRALRALPSDQLWFVIEGKRFEQPIHNSLLVWRKAAKHEFTAGSLSELLVDVELDSPSAGSATFFRDLRLVVRRPSFQSVVIQENFRDLLHHSSGLVFASRRDGVEVNSENEMTLEAGRSTGYKSYRFFLPSSFAQSVDVQVLLRGEALGEGSRVKLELLTPYAPGGVATTQELNQWSAVSEPAEVLSFRLERGERDLQMKYEVELRVELQGLEDPPRVSELAIYARSRM